MDKELLNKWLTALRSGEYKQTKYKLKETNPDEGLGHCCLGVLCEVIDPTKFNSDGFYNFPTQLEDAIIPPEFADNIGLGFQVEFLERDRGVEEGYSTKNISIIEVLATMNDDGNKSFEEIANYLELIFRSKEEVDTPRPPVIDLEYLETILDSFRDDPADSDYQIGYLMAIAELYTNIGGNIAERYGNALKG